MRQNLKRSYPWRRLNSTMFTDTAFDTIKTPTTTKPSGNGVVDILENNPHWSWSTDGNHVPETVLIQPYGTDTANQTFDLRIWGWQRCQDVTDLWTPVLAAQLAVTLGNIAATSLVTSGLLADTVVETYGAGLVTEQTDENDVPGFVELTLTGFGLLEFDFDRTGAVSANVLLKPLY